MLSLHVVCRVLRAPLRQAAADLSRLYSPSHTISTSCRVNARIDEDIFYTLRSKPTTSNKRTEGASFFSAGSAKRRAAMNIEGEPPSFNRARTPSNTTCVTLPTEPLGFDGWSQLKEKSSFKGFFEDRVFERLIKTGSDLKIAKSFLSYLAVRDGDIDYRCLLRYLVLCVEQNQEEEVCELYDIMRMKYESLDSGAESLFIRGLGRTERWRESIGILESMRKVGSASARNYADIMKVAADHEEVALAWTLYDEALQKNFLLPEEGIQSLFDAPQHLQDDHYRKRLMCILSSFRQNQIYPGEKLANSIRSWFESIPNESWRGNLTRIAASGHCQSCKQQIESINLTPEEYDILRKSVIDSIIKGEDTFRKTTPQELQEFLNFIKARAPYDIVVDGLNVAYNCSRQSFSQALLDVVSCLAAQGKRILVLGRKHMLVPSRKWVKQDIERMRKCADCFFLDNVSLDDPFLLYASLNSGSHCCFLTNDLLRDHKACLPDAETRRLFFKWQRGHQLVLPFYSPGKVILQRVLHYDTIVQSTDASYHIPYDIVDVKRASYEVPKTWLCLKKEENGGL